MGKLGALFFSFQGRSNRARWWIGLIVLSVIGSIIGSILLGGSMAAIAAASANDPQNTEAIMAAMTGLILPVVIISLIMLWPSLALYTKRWHDRGKSGWWTLISLIPVIGGIWLLVELGFLRGTAGPNKYGPDPLQG